MLDRIQKITSIGFFSDIHPASFQFRKLSMIYGDNGRGKSTLAALFKSYGENNAQLLANRRTIGSTLPQNIELLFSHGNRAAFDGAGWSAQHSGVHVYDIDFVENSVYSGGEINAAHRKRLLSFALGKQSVSAMKAFKDATDTATEKTSIRKLAEGKLERYRGELTLSAFVKLKDIPNAIQEIADLEKQLRQADNMSSLQTRKIFQPLPLFSPDIAGLIAILAITHEQLSSEAEKIVKAHVSHIGISGFRAWAHSGLEYLKDECCPFCKQSVSGVQIVEYYKECFDEAYNRLTIQVATLDQRKQKILSSFNLPLLQSLMEHADSLKNTWANELHLKLVFPDQAKIKQLHDQMGVLLTELIALKKSSPLTAVDAALTGKCLTLLKSMNDYVATYNESVETANISITAYRQQLTKLPVDQYRQRLTELRDRQIRFSEEVLLLIEAIAKAKNDEKSALANKEALRDELNTIMKNTLGQYEQAINTLLDSFGARFQIREISYNYSGGGEPKSEYVIELKCEKLALSSEVASFRTSLSEGDKRTLAFAFFIAVVMNDAELQNKIVVIDDPMCSLDRHRRTQTLNVLKKIYERSHQLIVMAHDLYFLKSLRDEFERKKELQNVMSLRIVHLHGDHSDFSALDIDRECESAYYSNHRMVSGYLSGEAYVERDVATAIRPLLEGYLHRRYTGHVPAGLLFGEIVRKIAAAAEDSPLYHARDLVEELTEINTYAGKFHHDTNASAGTEMVAPGELRAYSRRALAVVYGGRVD